MARVYRAYDHRLRRWRAVKLLLPDFAQRAGVRRRFEAEAQALALLEHPHVVRIYDVGGSERDSYLVMELCEAGSVEDWLEHHGAMPPARAVEVMLAACEGMSAAHDAGIIHRDMKPANLLIDRHGVVKLTDFGIARTEERSVTRSGVAMGTLGYMAPEQHQSARDVDARADVYGLGATLYTLVTGNADPHLFTIDREPERLDSVVEPLRPIIQRAVAYAVDDRYPSVQALRDALIAVSGRLPAADSAPPLVWRALPELPVPEAPVVEAPPLTARRTVAPAKGETMIPLRVTQQETHDSFAPPDDAPDMLFAMTPAPGERTVGPSSAAERQPARPPAASNSGYRARFADLYVSEPEEDKGYVQMVLGPDGRRREVEAPPPVEEEPEAEPVSIGATLRALVKLGLAAVAVLAVGAGLVLAVQASGVSGEMQGARQAYWADREAFFQLLDARPALPQELGLIAAHDDALREARLAYARARSAGERAAAGEHLAALMVAEVALQDLRGGLSEGHRRVLAEPALAIQAQRRRADLALRRWQRAANTAPGGLVIRIGGAVPPPEE